MENTLNITVLLTTKSLIETSEMLFDIAAALDPKNTEKHVETIVSNELSTGLAAPGTEHINADKINENINIGIDLDEDRLPWDGRIHALGASGEHNKVKATNLWKKKRNVDPNLVKQVEAELRQLMSTPTQNVENGVHDGLSVNNQQPAIGQQSSSASIPADPYIDFISRVTASALTMEQINPILQKYQITSLPLLAARPDLIPAFIAELGI